MPDPDYQADLKRLPPRPFLKEQSAWAIAVYRFGRRNDRRRRGVLRWLGDRWYWLAFRVVETLTGISIPKSVEVGPGLRIYHFGNVFVHAEAKIGANCTLRQGVTIGERREGGPEDRDPTEDPHYDPQNTLSPVVRLANGTTIGWFVFRVP